MITMRAIGESVKMRRTQERMMAKSEGGAVPGFDKFRHQLRSRFPGLKERTIGEAWMRHEAHSLNSEGHKWSWQPGTFSIEASYGEASIKAAVPPNRIAECVDTWGEIAAKNDPADMRGMTRAFVLEAIATNLQTDAEAATMIVFALVWLAVTGPKGAELRPVMDKGEMAIGYLITDVPTDDDRKLFNFRLLVDEDTLSTLQGALP